MSRTAAILLTVLLIGLPASATRVTVPGTTVSVDVPSGFVPMPKSVIERKYPRGSDLPVAVYSTPGPDWDVRVAFALHNHTLPAGDLTPVQAELEDMVVSTPGLLRWVNRSIIKSGGREWIDLQFWITRLDLDTKNYNLVRVTRQGQKTLVVSAFVPLTQYSRYGTQLDAAMNGLK